MAWTRQMRCNNNRHPKKFKEKQNSYREFEHQPEPYATWYRVDFSTGESQTIVKIHLHCRTIIVGEFQSRNWVSGDCFKCEDGLANQKPAGKQK